MNSDIHQNKLLPFLFLSLLIHLALLKTLEFLPKNFITVKSPSVTRVNRPIKIRSISREQLKKYRTVGVRNGKKNFSLPTKSVKKVPLKTQKIQNTVKVIKIKRSSVKKKGQVNVRKKLSLNSLQVAPSKIKIVKTNKMKRLERENQETSKLKITTQNAIKYERTKGVIYGYCWIC